MSLESAMRVTTMPEKGMTSRHWRAYRFANEQIDTWGTDALFVQGEAPMDPSAEYRARAMRCEQLAQRANSETRRKNLHETAVKCERLAEDLEQEACVFDRRLPPPTD